MKRDILDAFRKSTVDEFWSENGLLKQFMEFAEGLGTLMLDGLLYQMREDYHQLTSETKTQENSLTS